MSKIIGYDGKNKRAVTDGVIARHWSIFRDLLMLAETSRDIGSLVRSQVVRIRVSDPDRTSSAGSKDTLNNRLLRNVINIGRDEPPLTTESQRPNINKWCNILRHIVLLFT